MLGLVREKVQRRFLCSRREKSPGDITNHCDISWAFSFLKWRTIRIRDVKSERSNEQMWWFLVVIAAGFEVGWATGLKYANDVLTWTLTVIAIIVSFGLLTLSSTRLPTATVYAIFVGLGTVGTVTVDIIIFGADINFGIIFFVVLLLIGVLGLNTQRLKKRRKRKVIDDELDHPHSCRVI
jgi:paired small multidrug resistance pump